MITKSKERAMIDAHKEGRELAKHGASRLILNERAQLMPVAIGDALIAGYYAELRRMLVRS